MKILVVANQDLASCCALNDLLPELFHQHHQLELLLSARVDKGDSLSPELKSLKYHEQELFVEEVFPELEQTHSTAELLSFNQLGGEYCRGPVRIENKINSEDGIALVRQINPDLIISIRYGVILKEDVISLPKHGVINLHSGGLPEYRGVMSTFRAMLNGDQDLHTTLHWIETSDIDQGSIIDQTSTAFQTERSYLWNVLALYPAGIKLILNAVGKLSAGEPLQQTEQAEGGAYYTFPTEKELQKFHESGFKLVDKAEIKELIKTKFTLRVATK